MTDRGKRYLELISEMQWHRAMFGGLSRALEIDYAARLDRLWVTLDEAQQEEIDRELQSIDATETAAETLGDDVNVTEGSSDGPRKEAA